MGAIDWSTADKFIKVEMDPAGGTGYVDLGTTQLLSVPYALYAGSTVARDTAMGIAGGDLTGSYPNPSIKNNAVNTAKIGNNAITTEKIASSSVTAEKITSGAVTSDKIVDNAVTSAKIANSTITSVKIEDKAITASKLHQMGASNNQILKWTSGAWAPSNEASGWSLTGNSVSTGSFIGTTNIQDIVFKRNGIHSGRIGLNSVSFGNKALLQNTTGTNNSAIGANSLGYNTIGKSNSSMGVESLYFNTTGEGNSAFGHAVLRNNITGSNNVGIGYYAGLSNRSGKNLTMVGYWVVTNDTAYTNSGAFGSQASITASNQYRIGSSTNATSIGGRVGWTTTSDGRFKTNVQENIPGLAFIKELRPVTYNLDNQAIESFINIDRTIDGTATEGFQIETTEIEVHSGFIAQEVEAAAEKFGYNFHGVDKPKNDKDYYGLRYAEFVVPLVKAVQEQQEIIDAQKVIINKEQELNAIQNERIAELERLVQELINRD